MPSLTEDFLSTDLRKPKPVPAGLDAVVYGLAGKWKNRAPNVRVWMAQAQEAVDRYGAWAELTSGELLHELMKRREIFRRAKTGFEAHLPEALSLLGETAYRSVRLRPFQVQIAGALGLFHGNIIEMATGEGKTLVAGLTGALWGWSGLPCHIITVNDYLAKRDSENLGPLYRDCGLSVGHVAAPMNSDERRRNYGRDVVYTTSKELTADFLRDRLILREMQHAGRRQIRSLMTGEARAGTVMRGIHSAIIDEADSLLIDEAVTPLIISRTLPNESFVEACLAVNDIARRLDKGKHYVADEQYREVELLPEAERDLSLMIDELPHLFRGRKRRDALLKQSLVAREFYQLNKQYVINEGKLVIVDDFTGRLMHQRTWQEGLHQLIEAKENLEISQPAETLARLSFQRFFRCFRKLGGMTGTAKESRAELWHVYHLNVFPIPLNKPNRRVVHPRRVFATLEEKWQAITEAILSIHASERPILVGTRSVRNCELLADRLAVAGLSCKVLNAKRHEEEALIISTAGQRASITVATNMAGRGTDIRLGDGVIALGGLHVIATECHESGRIDRQLFGRASRQGEPGSAQAFVSCEDELLARYLPAHVLKSVKRGLALKVRGAQRAAQLAVRWAQWASQRQAFKSRRSVLKMDNWLEDSLSFAPRNLP